MEQDIELIEIGGKTYRVKIDPLDINIDPRAIVSIDHSNIMGEILFAGTMHNQIGNLKAEMDNAVKNLKLDLDVFESSLQEKYKNELVGKGIKTTVSAIEGMVIQDPELIAKKRNFFQKEKQQQIIHNMYWGLSNKNQLLSKLSEKLQPEEFTADVLQKSFHNFSLTRVRV